MKYEVVERLNHTLDGKLCIFNYTIENTGRTYLDLKVVSGSIKLEAIHGVGNGSGATVMSAGMGKIIKLGYEQFWGDFWPDQGLEERARGWYKYLGIEVGEDSIVGNAHTVLNMCTKILADKGIKYQVK
jgi:hypothetical protein